MTDTALDRFVENIVSGLSDGEMCLFIEKIANRMRKEARLKASRENGKKGGRPCKGDCNGQEESGNED